MSRDYKLYREDMLEAIQKIGRYVAGMSFNEFKDDEMRVDAVVRNLEIIGEATKHVPPVIRQKYSSIEWRKIAGLRDIAIHAYFNVDINIVWDVTQNKLPHLQRQLNNILDQEKP